MNKKNKHPKRTFVPQAIGDAVNKINRKFSSNFGKIEFIIHSKWSDIAGSYFADFSEPVNITKIPDYENEIGEVIYKNHLNVKVAPAAALEFQHFKSTILEKINSYFGYKAIIDLRIQQNYIPNNNNTNSRKMANKLLSKEENKLISDELNHLDNDDLKESLFKLGSNIVKEAK